MKKVSIQIGITAIVLLLFCGIWALLFRGSFTDVGVSYGVPAGDGWEQVTETHNMIIEPEGIVSVEEIRFHETYYEVRLKALSPGEASVSQLINGREELLCFCKVTKSGFLIVDNTLVGGLEGYLLAVALFLAAVAVFFARYFLTLKGSALYSYLSIFSVGLAIFSSIGALNLFFGLLQHLMDPYNYSTYAMMNRLSNLPAATMWYVALPLLIFSVAMVISNIELLRHERPRFSNLLGLIIPFLVMAGLFFPFVLSLRGFSGSFQEYRIRVTLENTYSTIYLYFACMLAGSVICGLWAVKRKVPYDKDYILILGCRFKNDGTLTPLLQGRCDRAISFWKKQKEETGKVAKLVPSGGQGPDESMPEAEAMARYILTQGVPEEAVLREDQSKNTFQNMKFSKALIEKENDDARVAFSTTNYHVFRSGLWAQLAGLDADGIGAKTRWWFWPNAFMRECVGLMQNRIREEVILLIVTVVVCALLSFVTAV